MKPDMLTNSHGGPLTHLSLSLRLPLYVTNFFNSLQLSPRESPPSSPKWKRPTMSECRTERISIWKDCRGKPPDLIDESCIQLCRKACEHGEGLTSGIDAVRSGITLDAILLIKMEKIIIDIVNDMINYIPGGER